jgi:hypothetical protein
VRWRFCYDKVVWQRQAVKQGRSFVKHVLPAIIKPMHSLWNEVIGFLFCSFGVIFGFKAVVYWRHDDMPRLFFAGSCTILMAWYGISSFLRARKISKS